MSVPTTTGPSTPVPPAKTDEKVYVCTAVKTEVNSYDELDVVKHGKDTVKAVSSGKELVVWQIKQCTGNVAS